MKLISFSLRGKASYGLLTDQGVVDLGKRLDCADLKRLITQGIGDLSSYQDADYALSDITLLPPIPNPDAIWLIGMNTHSHYNEVKDFLKLADTPEYPTLITRHASTLVASGQALAKPLKEPSFDYEGEIALVIAKPCRNVSAEQAMDYVLGFSCFNDASARHYQMTSSQMTAGKNAYRSGGFGPCIVTKEALDINAMELTTHVNGELRQHMKLDDLIFNFAQLVAFISEINWLMPGDVIVTGSPKGVGVFQGKVLQPGDQVDVAISGIGTLSNAVVEQELSVA